MLTGRSCLMFELDGMVFIRILTLFLDTQFAGASQRMLEVFATLEKKEDVTAFWSQKEQSFWSLYVHPVQVHVFLSLYLLVSALSRQRTTNAGDAAVEEEEDVDLAIAENPQGICDVNTCVEPSIGNCYYCRLNLCSIHAIIDKPGGSVHVAAPHARISRCALGRRPDARY